MKELFGKLKTPLLITLVLMVFLIYPLLITGVGQVLFPNQANGSLIKDSEGKVVGSSLIGQSFEKNYYMKGRPSAVNYNTYTKEEAQTGRYKGVASGSQNLAPSNPELKKRVEADINTFLKANPTIKKSELPANLMTSSASGLDPHISPESAKIQISALSKSTGLSDKTLQTIIDKNTTSSFLGFLGEKTVNVLKVNLDISERVDFKQISK